MARKFLKFDVLNRFSGAVQFTAEIDCADDAPLSVKLGLAVGWAIKTGASLDGARLVGASLDGACLVGASLDGACLDGASLVGACLVGARLVGASLDGARLDGACLDGACLDGARLVGACLDGARLVGACLVGACLDGARLGDQWIIQGPVRSDGYFFFLQKLTGDTAPMVKAGCRYFTLLEARAHWTKTRGRSPLGVETMAILDCLEALARARNLT